MQLRLTREPSRNDATIGELFVDGAFQCYTLEDVVRSPGVKIYGQTAIPAGEYVVKLTRSPRFGVILPELLGVPNFIGIRIHAGNRKEDTEGCIIVGRARGEDFVAESRLALAALMRRLVEAESEIWIKIENPTGGTA